MAGEGVRIARATVRDARAVADLVAEGLATHASFDGYAKDLNAAEVREFTATFASEFLRREDAAAWLAFSPTDEVVGLLTAIEEERGVVFSERDVATLADAFVLPAWRRKGVLRALVARAEEWARERGLEACVVEHAMRNMEASAAWTRLGYGTIAATRRKVL